MPGGGILASAIRHCRHFVNFCISHNDQLYLIRLLDGNMDHDPIKISIFVILMSCFKNLNGEVTLLLLYLLVTVVTNRMTKGIPHASSFRDLFLLSNLLLMS